MEYLIRFIQIHETFRQPETNALAELTGVKLRWVYYSEDSPFAIIALENIADPEGAARALIARSILSQAVYELWATGSDYASLHRNTTQRTSARWPAYKQSSFRFDIDGFHGSRSLSEKRAIIESFSYMSFEGPIVMENPEHTFTIFEDYALKASEPHTVHLGRLIAESGRKAMNTYNLKKRRYISTTSMDAELSLVTANLALSAPGRLVYDPFMGTGSFPVACAHFGSVVFGSDLDGRSIRGKGTNNVATNFVQYGTTSLYLGGFTADITNTPLASGRILDAIICDPPYGVREGLKVLGHVKERLQGEIILSNGTPAHLQQDYVPPKRPYSFLRMLDDVLDFSATRLVDNGRLCMWMPVAGSVEDAELTGESGRMEGQDVRGQNPVENPMEGKEEEEQEYAIPQHPCLEVDSVCRQNFNKWSRRLLTYRRVRDSMVDTERLASYQLRRETLAGTPMSGLQDSADDLNDFRKRYFQGFKSAA